MAKDPKAFNDLKMERTSASYKLVNRVNMVFKELLLVYVIRKHSGVSLYVEFSTHVMLMHTVKSSGNFVRAKWHFFFFFE